MRVIGYIRDAADDVHPNYIISATSSMPCFHHSCTSWKLLASPSSSSADACLGLGLFGRPASSDFSSFGSGSESSSLLSARISFSVCGFISSVLTFCSSACDLGSGVVDMLFSLMSSLGGGGGGAAASSSLSWVGLSGVGGVISVLGLMTGLLGCCGCCCWDCA
jgi:hypothetical protein